MVHLKELALFAGAGGGILGGKLLGWRTVCAVEIEPYCREVLMRRQDEGHLDPFPIWDDVRTFDGTEWRGKVDVVSGGFPCQDISVAGKGDGLDGERSGLWREMARIIGEVRPRFAFVENSPALVRRGLDTVLGDLAAMGYDCRWGVISAADVGAPHLRERVWIVAHTDKVGRQEHGRWDEPLPDGQRVGEGEERRRNDQLQRTGSGGAMGNAESIRRPQREQEPPSGQVAVARTSGSLPNATSQRPPRPRQPKHASCQAQDGEGQANQPEHVGVGSIWPSEPDVGRVANGVANRVDRLSAIGNGQVSRVAAAAWRILGGP